MATEIVTQNATPLAQPRADYNPAAVYLASLSPGSRRAMREALDLVARLLTDGQADAFSLPWAALQFQHVQAVRAALAERYKPATCNKVLSALRGVLRAAWQLGQMDAERYHLAASVPNVRGEVLPAGRAVSGGELSALMAACAQDPSPAGARDAAIIALLYSCGLRRAELAALRLADYDPETGTLRIVGKRRKERLAYVVNGAAAALADWLAVRGQDPGPLFCPVRKDGQVLRGQGLTTQAVYNILQKRGREVGIKHLSPHDFRRTFVSDLLDAGADIVIVQRLAGHANVQTTARYDRRPEAAKARAAGLLHVPYYSRGRM